MLVGNITSNDLIIVPSKFWLVTEMAVFDF